MNYTEAMLWLRHNVIFIFLLLLTFRSMVFQYQTTKPTNFRELTEIERVGQLRRMNEYPPTAYRLANYLEKRPEAVAYYKLEKNFVDVFDLSTLFTVYFSPLLLPFFLVGLLEALSRWPKQTLILAVLPVLLMSLIGQANSSGPISLYPLIIGASIYGMMTIIQKFSSRHASQN